MAQTPSENRRYAVRYKCPACCGSNTYGGDPYACIRCGYDGRIGSLVPPRAAPEHKQAWCYLGADQLDRLDHATMIVAQALDTCYLVGSCLTTPDWRDVDVRVILDDDHYARLFTGPGTRRTDPFWSLLCASITEYLRRLTDLPIDFQVQSMTHANETYPGPRHPVGTPIWDREP